MLWSAARSTSIFAPPSQSTSPGSHPGAGLTHTSPMAGMTTAPNWISSQAQTAVPLAPGAPQSTEKEPVGASDSGSASVCRNNWLPVASVQTESPIGAGVLVGGGVLVGSGVFVP